MLALEIPRGSQAVKLGLQLLLLGVRLIAASCCLFERIEEVVKQEPRPAIHRENQLRWGHMLGGAESLGISKVSQTVLASLMESHKWLQLAGSVVGEFRKGTMSSVCLDATYLSSSWYATGAFQAVTLVLELRGSESE